MIKKFLNQRELNKLLKIHMIEYYLIIKSHTNLYKLIWNNIVIYF